MTRWIRPALASTALLFAVHASHAQPLNIRIGYSDAAMHLTPVLFLNKSILKHYGKSYTVEARQFVGGPPQIAALAANETDIIAASFQSLPQIINKAKLDVRVIADVIQS